MSLFPQTIDPETDKINEHMCENSAAVMGFHDRSELSNFLQEKCDLAKNIPEFVLLQISEFALDFYLFHIGNFRILKKNQHE